VRIRAAGAVGFLGRSSPPIGGPGTVTYHTTRHRTPCSQYTRGRVEQGGRLSVAELRRLLPALRDAEEHREQRRWWSRFRRQQQAGAQRGHVLRRARQAPRAGAPGPPPRRVPRLPALTPAHWAQISPLLPRSRLGRPASAHRLMLEGIRWVMRTGGSWRALPDRFGPWSTVAGCYHRWRHAGIWERIRRVLLTPMSPSFPRLDPEVAL
jgi:hypothetical protein